MKRSGQLALLAFSGLVLPIVATLLLNDSNSQRSLLFAAGVGFLAFIATWWMTPLVAAKTASRGICGKDLNKRGTSAGDVPIPEAAGLAPGLVFLLSVIVIELLQYYDVDALVKYVGSGFRGEVKRQPISDAWLVDYNAALASIGFMLFLGFVDDVLDVRWRVKLILPLFAAMPLLVAYSGGTSIYVPKPLQAWLQLPPLLDLGVLYTIYMLCLTIFCTNSINILAGVNGLEAGQTFVIACAILLHNIWEISGYAGSNPASRDGHLFSAYLMFPLAFTTLGLLTYNWYPSAVFVGDTFTYFAGMAIAVAGILGHFSETLLLFMIPQVFNFVYSIPQLFGWVFCPRHRLPVFDPSTGQLRPKDQPDWNLVNLALQLFGITTELQLCVRLLLLQAFCCGLGFVARTVLQGVYK